MTAQPALQPLIERPPSPYHGLRMSEAQYLALPEEKPYLEYVDGVVLQKPMPKYLHQRTSGEFNLELGLYARVAGGTFGPEGRVHLPASANYRVPDISYWAPGRHTGDDSLPTLAIEVRSPGQSMNELRAKCRAFRAAGVDACWIVDPESRTAEIFEGDRQAEPVAPTGSLESAFLPGFSLPLAVLFARVQS